MCPQRKGVLTQTVAWMEPEVTAPREINQTPKGKDCRIPLR